jgi:hypothetical protein
MTKTIALIVAVASLSLAGCCTTHHPTKWEYKQLSSPQVTDATINQLGNEGWNVVGYSSAPGTSPGFYILKRPKQ